MQIKVIPASQFENQLEVNRLKTRRELNEDQLKRLRKRKAKIQREIQDYLAANREATREITDLEAQIKSAIDLAQHQEG